MVYATATRFLYAILGALAVSVPDAGGLQSWLIAFATMKDILELTEWAIGRELVDRWKDKLGQARPFFGFSRLLGIGVASYFAKDAPFVGRLGPVTALKEVLQFTVKEIGKEKLEDWRDTAVNVLKDRYALFCIHLYGIDSITAARFTRVGAV